MAETQDVAAASPSRRRIVGYDASLSAFAACAVLVVFVISWASLAGPSADAGDLLNVLPPMCVMVTVFCLLGSSRVVVDPEGFIEVIDPLVSRRVPVGEVVGIEHVEGLQIRLQSGRRVGSVAYGASLLGFVLRYPRPVRAARRIEAAIGGLRDRSGLPAWQQDTVRPEPRVRAYLGVLAVDAVLVLGAVVLNLVRG